MAGITGMGTSFNLPNYAGELFAITPSSTPLLSAIGGLTGGRQTTSQEFEWQTSDLRDPAQRTKVEGATAPTAEARVRANVRNVVQIHQEKVEVSYTKQAAFGALATPGAAPFRSVDGSNPVSAELSWQVAETLKSIALDVNFSFINGTFANPNTNGTARRTRGLLEAITTNRIAKGTTVTGATSATNVVTSTAHGLANGDAIVFTATGAATNVVAGRVYYVVSAATDAFGVATSPGGTALALGTASGLAFTEPTGTALTTDVVGDLMQLVYDNGGITEQETATLLVNSSQKRALTHAYADAYGKFHETSRTVGGVSVDTIMTDFGTLNVMLDRHVPQDVIIVTSLEQLAPVFLSIGSKGVFFEEPLAKVGASDAVQLYGEIGFAYGNERAHGVLTGLAV